MSLDPRQVPGGCAAVIRRERTCDKPATVAVAYGCVHEHVHRALACPTHAEMAARGKGVICTDCHRGPDPHRCEVLIQVRPDLNERRLDGKPAKYIAAANA